MAIPEREKIKIEVRGELWIDPLNFPTLAARKTALIEEARLNCSDLAMRDVDVVVKETAPRVFLEIFTNELMSALSQSKPFLCNSPFDKKSSREQMCPNKFSKENIEEDCPPLRIAIKVENCSSDSQRNSYRRGQSSSKRIFEESSAEEISITSISTLPETCSNNLLSNGSSVPEDNSGLPVGNEIPNSPISSPEFNMKVEIIDEEATISEMPPSLDHSIDDSMQTSTCLDSHGNCISTFPQDLAEVKTETCEYEIIDGDPVSSKNYFRSCSYSNLQANKDKVNYALADSAILVYQSVVKGEPLEENGVPLIHEMDSSNNSAEFDFQDMNSTQNDQTVSDGLYFKIYSNDEMLKESSVDKICDSTNEDLSKNLRSYSVKNPYSTFDTEDILPKREVDEDPSDFLDFMPLSERIHLLNAATLHDFKFKPTRKSKPYKTTGVDGADGCDPEEFDGCARRRKRKKTATDSVEVALEEDAPGLLQGLIDSGINLAELKLYGCEEDSDLIDCASEANGFEDFEDVMYKIFSERPRNSLLKLNLPHSSKGRKAMYCLACLVSLIEQVRYLHFRKSPVEWGWCRDLRSFIFVFQMHNRIVLERPEYGYATYFFELLSSHPVEWQIRRLVIAMKLANFCRITIIENNPLLVGEDISEGEACVLEEYGWRRNSGLGSMLNYCDRVVHDRIQERRISDWRLRIGKLLMAGYEGGRVVHSHNTQQQISPIDVKLES